MQSPSPLLPCRVCVLASFGTARLCLPEMSCRTEYIFSRSLMHRTVVLDTKTMKRALLGLLILVFALSAAGQSRRVPPAGPAKKGNERPAPPPPTPTPVPETVDDAPDSGDVVSVDTKLVTIPVRILDKKNRFIGGLPQTSFTVFEDGVQQEIAYFTNEAQPFTVALVLDMSYSTTFKISEIQAAAIAFIDQLRPDDKVMVISFDQEIHLLCDATNDRGTIHRAIRRTAIATGTSLYDTVNVTLNDRLRRINGRKAVVLFTDGVDTTSEASNDSDNLRDALEMDALIYPIRYDTFADVQSMKGDGPLRLPLPGQMPPTTPRGVPNTIPGTGIPIPATPSDKGTSPEEYRHAEEYLTKLADLTGGRIYLASSFGNLNGAFAKIASELREFYSLGYYPTSEEVPGRTRRLKVKVDQPGVIVKARNSYAVPEKKKLKTS